ncbi:MAG TPA: ABC transporter permease subunit, partial [Stellaceae bacterium]|nr:ABC transporter permease subunit [Stellaceae bacterium]
APDLAITLTAFISAFVTGVFFALVIGFALNLSTYGRKMLLPLLVLGVTIPKVTLLPLFILWFGIAQTPVIVFGALSGFFPMVINVTTAGGEVKPNQILLAKAMGFGPLQIFRKVTLPAMLPVLVSGLFYACNASMMGVFIVELALARHGLGAVVHDLAVTFQTADMYAAVLLTASITVAVNMALWYAARYFGRWRA